MLTPPDGLPEDALVSLLAEDWHIKATSVAYRPVGWGCHHWEVVDDENTRWFVTANELDNRRNSEHETRDVAFDRLSASMAAAHALRAHGYAFVVAPLPTVAGEIVVRARDAFGVTVNPFVDGQSFEWGEFPDSEHRRAVLDFVVALHTAPAELRRHAMTDDFGIPYRDAVTALIETDGGVDTPVADHGPYARPTAELLGKHAGALRRLFDRYDALVAAHASTSRAVLTHGETHPGNTMRTADGWLLIDWDTALLAPPERDLWSLDPGDGSILAAYANATGVSPLAETLELYRLGWDLKDLAVDVARFRRPHGDTVDDRQTFDLLRGLVKHIAG
jgi:spectinomycin phosphotransferase/16S rRNA (guanine(1405)-N(7))-methyltransferase